MSATRPGEAWWRCQTGVAGWSLPEVMIALVLGLLIVHLGLDSLARMQSARSRIAVRTDALVALRVSRHVLRRELRLGTAERDWWVDGDSLALRAFRGVGLVCVVDSTGAGLRVSYTGDRAPDPAKDSLLLYTDQGVVEARALVAVAAAPSPCAGLDSAEALALRLDRGAPSGAVLAKLFERGTYHLTDAALRYRRGASGRQPLTPEVWSSSSGWRTSPERLGADLVPLDPAAGAPVRLSLAWLSAP